MKILILFVAANVIAMNFAFSQSQGAAINTTGASADPKAILDVSSTTQGMLIPRMSTTDRNAITGNIPQSLLIFNTTTNCLEMYANGIWQNVFCAICPIPSAVTAVASPTTLCAGSTLTLTGSATNATTWSWIGPNNYTSNLQSPTISNITTAGNGVYTLTASNSCGPATAVSTSSVTVNTVPLAPTAGTNTPSQTQIVWNWNVVSGANYKWNTTNNYSTATDVGTSTTYTQTGLTCNTAYTLYVWAYNSCGNSSMTTLTQTTSSCCVGTIALDATNAVITTTTVTTSTLTINTTVANEVILIGVAGCCATFNGNVTVTGAGAVSQVASVNGNESYMTMFACISNTSGSHTIIVTWGTNWTTTYYTAYAASFNGFCGTPSIAGNIQTVTAVSTLATSISGTITPAVPNSCLFADYSNLTANSIAGVVSWTNENLIRTDHTNGGYNFDGSIANRQLPSISPITITAIDNINSYHATGIVMILAVVHP